MEIICIDKRTFDELVVRSQHDREKSHWYMQSGQRCRTEKMDGQSGGMRDSPHIKENASGIS